MCFHDYEIVKEKTYLEIQLKVECDNLEQDYVLDTVTGACGRKYKKKVCLKCGKVVDQITPIYNKILKELKVKAERQERAKELIDSNAEVERPKRNTLFELLFHMLYGKVTLHCKTCKHFCPYVYGSLRVRGDCRRPYTPVTELIEEDFGCTCWENE